MKPILKWMPLMLCSSVALSGCGLFQSGYYYDRNDEYRNAEMSEPLQLPDSQNAIRYQDSMPVPQADSDFMASEADPDAPRPAPLAASGSSDQPFAEMRKAGSESWLLVSAAPASVWPRLQGFVADHGVETTAIDPASGRIDTPQGSLSVRQGLRGGTSEVRCDVGASAQCLSAVKAYLEAGGDTDTGVSLAAQPLDQSERIKLQNRGDSWQLALALDGERAWSEILYQLQNAFDADRLTLVDQNRSAGQFYVDYRDRDASAGSWGGWANPVNWFGEDAAPATRYRLQLQSQADSTTVGVEDPDGGQVPASASRDLLDAIAATLR
ncbi:outer membrane protein assembly factor BamC [Salinicola aestuarinus]|uniref:outer membrane protein assembly factor BamC n=1 Tax=Salinicola aestuarinus TaxID=1949082 RepID=UPI000DA2417C|nr:outer membrane protein assembly factor BamC [Salinicola aestuarinus]